MATRPIGAFLDSGDGAGRLISQASLLLRLRKTAEVCLPEPLRRATHIAAYKQGKVVIFAENNAIAAKLRLLAPRMIELWGQNGFDVSAIRIEAQASAAAKSPQKAPMEVSASAGKSLASLAQALPDSALRQSVESLARKARRG
jgi:hypothetical protein